MPSCLVRPTIRARYGACRTRVPCSVSNRQTPLPWNSEVVRCIGSLGVAGSTVTLMPGLRSVARAHSCHRRCSRYTIRRLGALTPMSWYGSPRARVLSLSPQKPSGLATGLLLFFNASLPFWTSCIEGFHPVSSLPCRAQTKQHRHYGYNAFSLGADGSFLAIANFYDYKYRPISDACRTIPTW